MKSDEIWKDITGYEGKYQISSFGRVKSLKRFYVHNDRICQLHKNTRGYYFARLCKDSVFINAVIHRLVATHFIHNPDNLPEVNHKNGEKADNSVQNLEWVTHKENVAHALSNKLYLKGEHHGRAKITESDVRELRKLRLETKAQFKDLAKMFGISTANARAIVTRESWKHIS